MDGVSDEGILRYSGTWSVEQSIEKGIEGDLGLVSKSATAHSAISTTFNPINTDGKTLVVQYEVKLQKGLECGGAYMKLLTHDPNYDSTLFDDKTPYTIMFGPDKCGSTNKVHFIFRHKNPKTGVYEEKHASNPPSAKSDTLSHLYTLIVRPDQSYEILIDNVSELKGSLLKDMTPPVNPEKEINDPSDLKPSTWVDESQIQDPASVKPADWDESAPVSIPDLESVQPFDWLTDAPLKVPDATAERPLDWDDEEDGEWTAPLVENPVCATVSGCGEWTRPMIPNPAFKGKWSPPMIPNPAYKGEWVAKKIDNPDYFEDKNPSHFTPIGALGFEIWSLSSDILFDNIYLGHSEADAKAFAKETYVVKAAIEKANAPPDPVAEAEAAKKTIVGRFKAGYTSFVENFPTFIATAKTDPIDAIKSHPEVVIGILVTVFVPLILSLLLLFWPNPTKKEKTATTSTKVSTKKEESKKKKEEVVDSKLDTDDDDGKVVGGEKGNEKVGGKGESPARRKSHKKGE